MEVRLVPSQPSSAPRHFRIKEWGDAGTVFESVAERFSLIGQLDADADGQS